MVTFTTNYDFALPGINDPTDANQWGGYLNSNWSALDTLLATFPSPNLTAGNIYVGDATNVAASVSMSGDITIDDAGVTTIGLNKVTLTKLATQAANTVLVNASAVAASPTALNLNTSTLLGRGSSGNIAALTAGAGITIGVASISAAPITAESLGTNGYASLVGGLTIQWGTSNSITGISTGAVTFPIAFSTAVYSINITRNTTNSGAQASDFVTGSSTAGFTIHNQSSSSGTFYWIAIGQ